MPWFRASAMVFSLWGVIFFVFPAFTNQFAGIGFVGSKHATDWTQLVGLFCLSFAVLLEAAHRSASAELRRIAARSALTLTLPSAVLMTYWQLIPDRQWVRLDILNIVLLLLMSFGLFSQSDLWRAKRSVPTPS